MKYLILLLTCSLTFLTCSAQEKSKLQSRLEEREATRVAEKEQRKMIKKQQSKKLQAERKRPKRPHVYVSSEMSVFYNLNSADVQGEGTPMMKSKNNMGLALGVGGRLESRGATGVFLSGHFGWRMVPQQLITKMEHEDYIQRFDNHFLYFKLIAGIKFPIIEGKFIDLGVGFQNFISLNNKTVAPKLFYESYTDPVTGEALRQLRYTQATNWGQSSHRFPLLFNPTIQLGYTNTKLLKGNKLRIAIEVSTKVVESDDMSTNNHALFYQFDKQRNVTRSEKFNDRHTTIGLNLSIAI